MAFVLVTRYHKPCRKTPSVSRKIVASGMRDFICSDCGKHNFPLGLEATRFLVAPDVQGSLCSIL